MNFCIAANTRVTGLATLWLGLELELSRAGESRPTGSRPLPCRAGGLNFIEKVLNAAAAPNEIGGWLAARLRAANVGAVLRHLDCGHDTC